MDEEVHDIVHDLNGELPSATIQNVGGVTSQERDRDSGFPNMMDTRNQNNVSPMIDVFMKDNRRRSQSSHQ